MPYKKYGKAPKRKLRQYRKKGRKMAKKPLRNRPRLRATIKDVVRREVETKVIGYGSNAPLTMNPYKENNLNKWGFVLELGPGNPQMAITQGTNNSQRIGNKIETKRLNLRLFLMPNKFNSVDVGYKNVDPQPFMIIIYIGYKKGAKRGNPNAEFPYDWQKFFTYGDTDQPPAGNLTDTFRHPNGDLYHICKRDIIKCGYQHQNPNLGQATAEQDEVIYNTNFFNNDFRSVVKRNYDLTKYYNKNITYDDNDTIPVNRGLYMWAEAVSIDGSVNGGADAGYGHLCKFWYEMRYEFKDA